MSTLQLENKSEYEITHLLKAKFENKEPLTDLEKEEILSYETRNYALLGLMGLLTQRTARILLGRKQPYDLEIANWCHEAQVNLDLLEKIANQYLDDDFSEEPEFILRLVMLEYPKPRDHES